MKSKKVIFPITLALAAIIYSWWFYAKLPVYGNPIDSFNGVEVYYNGRTSTITERNWAGDYNLGLKYQCVEFMKRYYYQKHEHKMPDSYGNAKDFFNPQLKDGQFNKARQLTQYTNGSKTKPQVDDLLVFGESKFNSFGHVAIVSAVEDNWIEIIQQNAGIFGSSREKIRLSNKDGSWQLKNSRVLGWLRLEK